MASIEPSSKVTEEVTTSVAVVESQTHHQQYPHGTPSPSVDLFLRILLFASTLTALIVMVTSKETKLIFLPLLTSRANIPLLQSAKFNHSPALIYFVAAMAVASFYSLVTIFASIYRTWIKPCPTTSLVLLYHIILDVVIFGIVVAAAGSAGGVAYVGLRGNSHVGWRKVCPTYGKFCRHVGSSIFLSLFASVLLILLASLSVYSLYRRSRQ